MRIKITAIAAALLFAGTLAMATPAGATSSHSARHWQPRLSHRPSETLLTPFYPNSKPGYIIG
jgi:hypothetical protein